MQLKLPLHNPKFLAILIAAIVVVILEVLAILGYSIPLPYAPIIYALFVLIIGKDILLKGIKALGKLKFSSVPLLMLIAVVAAFYLGDYAEGAVVMVLYVLGEELEDVGMDNSKSALDSLIDRSPKTAFSKNQQKEININEIALHEIVIVKPGQMIPVDGVIRIGNSSIDEAAISGEPMAKFKNVGDAVFAGTLNQQGYLEIETTKKNEETIFSKIVKLTFEANSHKSERQMLIQKFAKYYTPSILIGAILLFIISAFIFHHPINQALKSAISLLVISCPCALILSTPVAIFAAIGNASSKGILIKGGKYIEAMASIKAIALDKTRTITVGKPVVSDIILLNGTEREELLACTAGAEMHSEHPLAQAIVDASEQAGYTPHETTNFKSILGKGAIAECTVCKNEIVTVGNLDFIAAHESINPQEQKIIEQFANEGKSSVAVSFGKGVAGIFGLTDAIKPSSSTAIQELKALNIHTVILSGDAQNAVAYTAELTQIDEAFGNLLPDGKAAKIKELLQKYGSVAMVGDGINDAPALALSTVGIAMGAIGSDTAIDTANIALLNDNLALIPFLIKLSKRTVTQIKFNIIFALTVKAIFIILSLIGYSSLVLAIIADVGVTLFVILLSLRLMSFKD